MADIGNLAIKVSVDPSGVSAGIDAAVAKLQAARAKAAEISKAAFDPQFAAQARLEHEKQAKLIQQAYDKIKPQGIMSSLQGVIDKVPMLAAAFAAVSVGGLIGALSSVVGYLEEGRQKILEQGKLATKLGVTLKEAAAFQVLGSGREDFDKVISHMQRRIGEVRAEDPSKVSALGKVGIDTSGLTGKTVEDYKNITGQINKMSDATQRARAMQETFGRAWLEFADILAKGGGGLERATAQVKEYGVAVSEAGLMRVKLGEILKKQEKTEELGLQITMSESKVASGVKATMAGIRWKDLLDPTNYMGGTAGPGNFGGLIGKSMERQLSATSALFSENVKDANAPNQAFMEAASSVSKSLQDQMDSLGKSSTEFAVHKASVLAATTEEKAFVNTLRDEEIALTKAQNQLQLEGRGRQLTEETLSPLDKFRETMQEINNLEKAGILSAKEKGDIREKESDKIGLSLTPLNQFKKTMDEINSLEESGIINATEKAGLLQKQLDILQKSADFKGGELATGANYGSTASIDAINRFQSRTTDPMQNIAGILASAEASDKAREGYLKRLVDAWENMNEVTVP